MSEKALKVDLKVLDSRLGNEFPLPEYATVGSAGIDLRAMLEEPLHLGPGQLKMVSCGFAIDLGEGTKAMAVMAPRSGLGSKGLVLGNTIGIIDADYQGPLMMMLWNRTSEETFEIQPGDRVAQMVLVPVLQAQWNLVDEFAVKSARGVGGFGSSGKK